MFHNYKLEIQYLFLHAEGLTSVGRHYATRHRPLSPRSSPIHWDLSNS